MTQDLPVRDAALVRSRLIYAALAIGALTILWFLIPVDRALSNPDEARYAEIPREMLVSNDWVTPRLNDLAYLEKPPLQYWATALAYKTFGVSEWSARLCMTLSAWLDIVLVYLLARRLWGTRTGVIAAALLGSSVLHFVMGQVLTLDMTFTLQLTAMLGAFCMAQIHRDTERRACRWMLVSWLFLALAIMTKGVVALAIAGGVVVIYMVWQRDWAVWRTLQLLPGLALMLLITVPWFVLVTRANDDFLQFFFIHEHLLRYTTLEARRVEPWWYFIAILIAGVLPWAWQMIAALADGWRTTVVQGQFDVRRLLWVWCMFVLVFFSLSGSKLAPYILPVLPPLALLTAAHASSGRIKRLDVAAWVLLISAFLLLAYTQAAPSLVADPLTRSVAYEARPTSIAIALIAAVAALFYRRAARNKQTVRSIVSLATGWFLGLALLFATVGHDSSLRSGRDLAATIPADLAAQAPIFSVQTYDQSLPFYLQRTMILVDYRGELDYGQERTPDKAIADLRVFEQRWSSATQAIAIMSHKTYTEQAARGLPMRLLGKDRRRVAVSRR
jgi:4-amino-4-deoxy-L-arabinose transferase-like glycosyltransferase